MSSAPRVAITGAGNPVRGIPVGPVPTAGPRAADRLDVQGGHCRGGGSGVRRPVRLVPAAAELTTAGGVDLMCSLRSGPMTAAGPRVADRLDV